MGRQKTRFTYGQYLQDALRYFAFRPDVAVAPPVIILARADGIRAILTMKVKAYMGESTIITGWELVSGSEFLISNQPSPTGASPESLRAELERRVPQKMEDIEGQMRVYYQRTVMQLKNKVKEQHDLAMTYDGKCAVVVALGAERVEEVKAAMKAVGITLE